MASSKICQQSDILNVLTWKFKTRKLGTFPSKRAVFYDMPTKFIIYVHGLKSVLIKATGFLKLRLTATVSVIEDGRKPFSSISGQSVLTELGIKQEYAVIYYLYRGPGESGGVMRPPQVRR